ncbi:hypothetical protein H0H93_002729 [Arthromyces matolae]|nr:hypothetical protein H0H93_002729 [Arthromyces matolae]
MSLAAWYATRTAPQGLRLREIKEKKTHDPLFGPNIGVVSSGPAWTAPSEKRVLTDELTPDVVSNWIEKSKEPTQPTTTLQALVNLKRPSLRLSPLASEDSTPDHHHHGLEFEYDCDAPKCGIYVHVLLPKDHPDAPATASSSGLAKFLVFESVVDGGFGKVLKLEEGALLELGRFEYTPTVPNAPPGESSSGGAGDPSTPTPPQTRRRFAHIPFRKHSQSVSGPALRVLDVADPSSNTEDKNNPKDDSAEGVRVTIRLAALDSQGTELASPNEQVTYLHVVRFGAKDESSNDEDTRPWVVKVAKREATIGPHTFHLHEIYGLTSHGASGSSSQGPVQVPTHTYPPDATTTFPTPPLPALAEDDIQSESPTAPRRKRKAKGWFCPVCRQPYTSLLRITTQPPSPEDLLSKEAAAAGTSESGNANANANSGSTSADGAAGSGSGSSNGNPSGNGNGNGILNLAPAFFRGLSFRNAGPPPRPIPVPDIENQVGTAMGTGEARVGA